MDYKELKRHIGKAGMSTKEFASLIKVQPSSITNYAQKGEVPRCMAIVAALMGEMADNRLDFKKIVAELDVQSQPKKPSAFGRNKQETSSTKNE